MSASLQTVQSAIEDILRVIGHTPDEIPVYSEAILKAITQLSITLLLQNADENVRKAVVEEQNNKTDFLTTFSKHFTLEEIGAQTEKATETIVTDYFTALKESLSQEQIKEINRIVQKLQTSTML